VYIVGSHLKQRGLWSEPVETERVAALVRVADDLRKTQP
jgi:predicted TIM-barrel enzyme